MTTTREIALLRLAAQRIVGPGFTGATDAVRWLTALQAQDQAGALTSVALRTAGGTREDVEAALTTGEIVKSWPMRGTLHLLPAEDLPWLLELTTPRLVAGAAARRAALGLDLPLLERARELAVQALSGGRRLTRAQLLAAWDAGGLTTTGQRGYHMLWHIAQTGTVCFGPVADGEQQIVLVEEWIRAPRRLDRDEALGELALRYFAGHGPATTKDLTRWTGLVAADVRTGLAIARPRLTVLDVAGTEYLMDAGTPELLAGHRRAAEAVHLLPGFDEYVLGYGDRTAQLPAEFATRIVPGANGVFRPTVLSGGQIVGTWKHTGRGAKRAVAAVAFTAFPAAVAEAIPQVYAELPV